MKTQTFEQKLALSAIIYHDEKKPFIENLNKYGEQSVGLTSKQYNCFRTGGFVEVEYKGKKLYCLALSYTPTSGDITGQDMESGYYYGTTRYYLNIYSEKKYIDKLGLEQLEKKVTYYINNYKKVGINFCVEHFKYQYFLIDGNNSFTCSYQYGEEESKEIKTSTKDLINWVNNNKVQSVSFNTEF